MYAPLWSYGPPRAPAISVNASAPIDCAASCIAALHSWTKSFEVLRGAENTVAIVWYMPLSMLSPFSLLDEGPVPLIGERMMQSPTPTWFDPEVGSGEKERRHWAPLLG